MSAIIISSSPPPIFARSPTPVESSSPNLPSPSALLRGDSDGSKRFKVTRACRDSFSVGFASARTLLTRKIGAENIPVKSPGKEKFKASNNSSDGQKTIALASSLRAASATFGTPFDPAALYDDHLSQEDFPSGQRPRWLSGNTVVQENANNESIEPEVPTSSNKENSTIPVCIIKALPRRKDWTPVKDNNDLRNDDSGSPIGFEQNLLNSFGYDATSISDVVVKRAGDGFPTKRRKIELVKVKAEEPIGTEQEVTQTVFGGNPVCKSVLAKRNSSPTKKTLTITGLATAQYVNKPEAEGNTSITHYLEATQLDNAVDAAKSDAKKQKKPATKKAKSAQSKVSRSRLLSPQSAMKSFEQQETFFGSASQLAQDDSSNSIRNSRTNIKQSETALMSDPVSTQLTQPVSIESITPRTTRETSKFVKTRNLWSAAGRDEDNALLHVDNVDLLNTPAVRLAFAGKDALLEPGHESSSTKKLNPTETPCTILRGILSPFNKHDQESPYDIDSIVTPYAASKQGVGPLSLHRSYHTSTIVLEKTGVSTKSDAAILNNNHNPHEVTNTKDKPIKRKKQAVPKKPSYAGFSIHDLQKQISAYGFKPVKKREKMIELLDRCWEEKHGPVAKALESDEEADPKHGDFLGRVHDISSRPEPKIKKPRKKATEDKVKKTPTKEPRKRKKAEPKTKEPTPAKTPRKRKVKTPVSIKVDVEETSNSVQPIKSTNGADTEAVELGIGSAKLLDPSSMSMVIPDPKLSGIVQDAQHEVDLKQSKSGVDVGEKIRAAIMYESRHPAGTDRDHVRNPTWHEKILLYDPIILEDLTTWLNTSGMNTINEDHEVSAMEVRAWCESNGICCLWRGGWRGQKGKKAEE